MKRLACLDGLRGFLAVYVLIGHMAPFAALPAWTTQPFSHGGAAVDMFFILSGLVIAGSLERCGFDARRFLVARFARIYPVFLPVFALAVAVQMLPRGFGGMPWIAPDSLARMIWSEGWPPTWAPEILAHLTMTHGLFPNAVLPHVWVSFLGAAWSLSTEWQFYVLALCAGRCAGWNRAGAVRLIWLFVGLSACGQLWTAAAPETWQFSRAFLPNKAQYFALGLASWQFIRHGPEARVVLATVLAATLALCWMQGGWPKLLAPLAWIACLGAELAWPACAWLSVVLRQRVPQSLGAASYCIYLVNEPVQKIIGVLLASLVVNGDGWLFTLLWVPAAVLVPLWAAFGLHRHVEMPALRWTGALARRAPAFEGRMLNRS